MIVSEQLTAAFFHISGIIQAIICQIVVQGRSIVQIALSLWPIGLVETFTALSGNVLCNKVTIIYVVWFVA